MERRSMYRPITRRRLLEVAAGGAVAGALVSACKKPDEALRAQQETEAANTRNTLSILCQPEFLQNTVVSHGFLERKKTPILKALSNGLLTDKMKSPFIYCEGDSWTQFIDVEIRSTPFLHALGINDDSMGGKFLIHYSKGSQTGEITNREVLFYPDSERNVTIPNLEKALPHMARTEGKLDWKVNKVEALGNYPAHDAVYTSYGRSDQPGYFSIAGETKSHEGFSWLRINQSLWPPERQDPCY